MPMAISTDAGHVSRALDFYNTDDIYFCIGKSTSWSSDSTETSTVLTNDDNPPEPTPTEPMQEVIGYKKVVAKHLVYPNESGEYYCAGRRWKIVKESDDPYALGARWVYLSSELNYNELPTEYSFRQVGVFSGLKKKESVAKGKTALVSSEVEDPGVPQAIYHRKPVYRDPNQRELLTTIITF